MEATLDPTLSTVEPRTQRRWLGRILGGLPVAFLLFDVAIKLVHIQAVADASEQLGLPDSLSRPLAVILLACIALYLVPRTAVLGAVLLTGYLGGAIAIHARVGDPLLSHTLFPIYVAILLWGGLYLRDARVRAAVGPVR